MVSVGTVPGLPLGVLLGLVAGVGLLFILDGIARPGAGPKRRMRVSGRALAQGMVAAIAAATLALVVTGVPVIAVLAAATGSALPGWWRRRSVRRLNEQRMAAWPDAVDDLRSEVRAGVGLPEAVAALAVSGPMPLRPRFASFLAEYRATGSFRSGLGTLTGSADPVAERVVAALTVARELGGSELGTVLATLSTIVREDARARAEIRARQSWTVTAARLAVAAPWLTVIVMCTRPGTVEAYRGPAGAMVLGAVALVSLAAYRLMSRVGRLPVDAGGVR